MDEIDRKLLAILQQDATLSIAQMADKVGLSATPCWKRVQKLEAAGVITRRVALGHTAEGFIACIDASAELLAQHIPRTQARNQLPNRLVML